MRKCSSIFFFTWPPNVFITIFKWCLIPSWSTCQFRSKSSSLLYWSALMAQCWLMGCAFIYPCTQILIPLNGMGDWLEILRHEKVVLLIQMRYNILQMSVNYYSGQIDIDNMRKIKRRLNTCDTNCYQQGTWCRCPDAS